MTPMLRAGRPTSPRVDSTVALDDASLEGKPTAISSNIDLVSHLFDDSFGEANDVVASIDPSFNATPVRQAEQQ